MVPGRENHHEKRSPCLPWVSKSSPDKQPRGQELDVSLENIKILQNVVRVLLSILRACVLI